MENDTRREAKKQVDQLLGELWGVVERLRQFGIEHGAPESTLLVFHCYDTPTSIRKLVHDELWSGPGLTWLEQVAAGEEGHYVGGRLVPGFRRSGETRTDDLMRAQRQPWQRQSLQQIVSALDSKG